MQQQVVPGPWKERLEIDPMPIHVGFVVDKVALERVSQVS